MIKKIIKDLEEKTNRFLENKKGSIRKYIMKFKDIMTAFFKDEGDLMVKEKLLELINNETTYYR